TDDRRRQGIGRRGAARAYGELRERPPIVGLSPAALPVDKVADELSDLARVRARTASVVGYDLKPHGPGVARLRFGDIGKPDEDGWINARGIAVALEVLID